MLVQKWHKKIYESLSHSCAGQNRGCGNKFAQVSEGWQIERENVYLNLCGAVPLRFYAAVACLLFGGGDPS